MCVSEPPPRSIRHRRMTVPSLVANRHHFQCRSRCSSLRSSLRLLVTCIQLTTLRQRTQTPFSNLRLMFCTCFQVTLPARTHPNLLSTVLEYICEQSPVFQRYFIYSLHLTVNARCWVPLLIFDHFLLFFIVNTFLNYFQVADMLAYDTRSLSWVFRFNFKSIIANSQPPPVSCHIFCTTRTPLILKYFF